MQKFCHGWSEAVHWVGKFFISNIIQSSNMWYYQELMVKQHQQTIGSWFRKFFWDWHFFPAHDASTVPGSFTVCSSVSTIFFSWYQIGQIQTRYKQEIFEHKSFWRLGGGVCFMFIFTPNLGEIIQFDLYFVGLKPPNFWALATSKACWRGMRPFKLRKGHGTRFDWWWIMDHGHVWKLKKWENWWNFYA